MASARSRALWNPCKSHQFEDTAQVDELVRAATNSARGLSVAQELRRARASSTIKTSLMSYVEAAGVEARLPPGEYEKWLYTVLLRESIEGATHSTKTARRRARNDTKGGTAAEMAEAVRASAVKVVSDPLIPLSARPGTDGGVLQHSIAALGINPKRAGAIVSDVCKVASKLALDLGAMRERSGSSSSASSAASSSETASAATGNGLRIEWEGAPAPGSKGVPTLVSVVAATANDASVTAAKAFASAAIAKEAAKRALGVASGAPSAAASSAASAAADEGLEASVGVATRVASPWLDEPLAEVTAPSSVLCPSVLAPAAARSMAICHKKTRMRLTLQHYHKLGELYARGPGRLEPWRFHERLFLVLLRYHGTQGGGFQAAAHAEVFESLNEATGADMECFASPLNCRYAPFCTAFPDTDIWFGGLCSFFDAPIHSGSFEANPPFVPAVLDEMQSHIESLLGEASSKDRALSVSVIIPAWEAGAGWSGLATSKHLSRKFTLAQRDHGYLEGSQHWRRSSFRVSTCDTTVFVLQSPTAAKAMPFTDAAEVSVRQAFKSKHTTLEQKRALKALRKPKASKAAASTPRNHRARPDKRHREAGAGEDRAKTHRGARK